MNDKFYDKLIKGNARKLLVIAGVFTAIFGLLTLLSRDFAYKISEIYKFDLTDSLIPVFSIFVSVAAFSVYYLQYGGKRPEDVEGVNEDELFSLKKSIRNLEKKDFVTSQKLREMLNDLMGDMEVSRDSQSVLSDAEKKQLIHEFKEGVYDQSASDYLSEHARELEDQISQKVRSHVLENEAYEIKVRLKKEIRDLRLRANVNLIFGILITFGGLYLLWDTVAILDSSEELKNAATGNSEMDQIFYKSFVLEFIPRLTLIVFIEIFAYFFLKLYKSGLGEIKYFQNELTNIDAKILALHASSFLPASDGLSNILEKLSSTERNYILEKGQTTVDLEKAKSEGDLTKSLLKALPELIKSKTC